LWRVCRGVGGGGYGNCTPYGAAKADAPVKGINWWLWGGVSVFAAMLLCAGLAWMLPRWTQAPVHRATQTPVAVVPVSDPSLKTGQTRSNRRIT